MLTVGDEVRNLLGRYTELVDRADWAEVGRLFAHGRLAAEDGSPLAVGEEAVAAFYRDGTRLHDGSPRTKHVVTDTVLVPESAERVVARSSYVVLQGVGSRPPVPIIAGRYVDTFEHDAARGGWHFVERRFSVDLTGDLSEHLTWAL